MTVRCEITSGGGVNNGIHKIIVIWGRKIIAYLFAAA
jgi:hypothetical protein